MQPQHIITNLLLHCKVALPTTTYPSTECHPLFQSRSKTATAGYGKAETVGCKRGLMMTSKSPDSGSGIRSTRTTGVFRALNFELFVKPVRSQFVTTLQNLRIVELLINYASHAPPNSSCKHR